MCLATVYRYCSRIYVIFGLGYFIYLAEEGLKIQPILANYAANTFCIRVQFVIDRRTKGRFSGP